MFTLVYRSLKKDSFEYHDILKMMQEAKSKNEKLNITGCLMYHDGRFVQLLEGDEADVKKLYKTIRKDSRHHRVRLLNTEENHHRLFNSWNMIYDNLDEYSDQIYRKRKIFKDLFKKNRVFMNPSISKLTLWKNVHEILEE